MAENKAKKITKKDRFEDIRAMLHGEVIPTLEDGTPRTSLAEADQFIDHEIELLNKKNASTSGKQTQTKIDNNRYRDMIMEYLRSRVNEDGTPDTSGMTCTAICKTAVPEIADAGTSKFSYLCNGLVADHMLQRNVAKGGEILFSLA